MSSHAERIREGLILPWVGSGADGARRSAVVARDELDTLAAGDPRREEVEAQEQAWLDLAARLEEHEGVVS